jgi:hypothetical protein
VGDFVKQTAELNAYVRDLAEMVERDAEKAIESQDGDQLVAVLRDAVILINALVEDLASSRAEGAVVYERDPEFRDLVDRISETT